MASEEDAPVKPNITGGAYQDRSHIATDALTTDKILSQLTCLCVNLYVRTKTSDQKTKAGVYLLFCLWKGIAYVGRSDDLPERFRQHFDLLRLDRHTLKSLQKD